MDNRRTKMNNSLACDVNVKGSVSQKILSHLVILSMEKTVVTMVISELKSVSKLKILPETGP